MTKMLDFYQSRMGTAKRQGGAYNGPCPSCGGEHGRSDRFVIWPDRTDNIGKSCQEHNISGVFWCRQCGISGDSIEYFTKCEGFSFKEACHELGISENARSYSRRRCAPSKKDVRKEYEPLSRELPSAKWAEYANKILSESFETIHTAKAAKKWLLERGINDVAIERYKLGYLNGENGKQGRYRARSVLGLDQKERVDGTKTSRIFIPRGIVIPSFLQNDITSLRFRRPSSDISETNTGYKPPKYIELEGSSRSPYILLPKNLTSLTPFVVVEAEFDAMLCHSAMEEQVGVIALRSNRNKPCPRAHELLRNCSRILFAMDYEEGHQGIAGIDFWEDTYPQLMRWPTPEGKDPGEAFALGVDIAEWLCLGMPESFTFRKKIKTQAIVPDIHQESKEFRQNGQVDASFFGVNTMGCGGNEILISSIRKALKHWELSGEVILTYLGKKRFKRTYCFGIVNPKFHEWGMDELEKMIAEDDVLLSWWRERLGEAVTFVDMVKELEILENE